MSSSRSIALDTSESASHEVTRSAALARENSVSVSITREDSGDLGAPPLYHDDNERVFMGVAASASARPASHSDLRIVIPAGSPLTPPMCQLEHSTNSPPTAPQTATVLPQYPRYPAALPAVPSLGSSAAYDPQVAAALSQITTQKSATVLLRADISRRRLQEAVRGGSRRGGASSSLGLSPADASLQPVLNADAQEAAAASTLSRSQSTAGRAFMESLSQIFQSRSRGKGTAKGADVASAQDDVELPFSSPNGQLAPSRSHRRSDARHSSGSMTTVPTGTTAAAAESAPLPLDSTDSAPVAVASSVSTAGHPVEVEPQQQQQLQEEEPQRQLDDDHKQGNQVPAEAVNDSGNSGGSNDNHHTSSSGSDNMPPETEPERADVGMDRVLEEATKVRGLRLTWLLYALIVLVICLFVLIFLLISFSTNKTLKQSGKHIIQSLTVSTTNNAELLRYDLLQFFLVVNATYQLFPEDVSVGNLTNEVLCSRMYGAPIALTRYDNDRQMIWSMVCDEERFSVANVPAKLPRDTIPSYDTPRLVVHSDKAVAAYYSVTQRSNVTAKLGTFVVFLSKAIVGRFLLSNFQPEYSTATLQSLDLGVLLPNWTTDDPQIAFTTLTMDEPYYGTAQPTRLGRALQGVFHDICGSGSSSYVWHSVVREDNPLDTEDGEQSESSGSENRSSGAAVLQLGKPARIVGAIGSPSRNSTLHSFPTPYVEYKGTWGIISRMALCSVLCADNESDTCERDNPSAIWFAFDTTLAEIKQESTLNVVGGISIVAVVIFSFVLLVAYIGISLPVHYLRYQLLRTVGSKAEKSGCERRIYTMTRRFWLSDLVSLVRAIHILSLCFRLNKKYVPEHVLRNHAKQLYMYKGRLGVLESSLEEVGSTLSDDDGDDDDDDDGNDARLRGAHGNSADGTSHLEGLSEFVAAAGAHHDHSQHARSGFSVGRREGADRTPSVSSPNYRQPPEDVSVRPGRSTSPSAGALNYSYSRRAFPSSASVVTGAGRREGNNSLSMYTEDAAGRAQTSFQHDFLVAEGSADFTMANDTGGGPVVVPMSGVGPLMPRPAMEIRRNDEATILYVHLGDVDNAYLMDYRVALKQHRRIMRFLLSRMRHYRGAVFYRSGECLAAVWNAFDSCYNHAEYAAACAQDIANAFAPYRADGLQLGIVLHQGTFVCGTVEDTREAFVTAFGEGPRQAAALAELAAVQPAFSVLITEPVKQALSAKYECFIVDVIRIPALINSLILFELGMPRAANTHGDVNSSMKPHSPMSSALIVQYAKAFALFRNHDFKAALDGIQVIRQNYACAPSVRRLLQRLEMMSNYYRHNDVSLPMPYSRAMPVWDNYELVAAIEGGLEGSLACAAPDDWISEAVPQEGSMLTRPEGSPTSTVAPARGAAPASEGLEDANRDAHSTATPTTPRTGLVNPDGQTCSENANGYVQPSTNGSTSAGGAFALPKVLYHKVLRVSDEEISFKRELHDNVKWLGTPAQKSPHVHPRNNNPLGADTATPSPPASLTNTPHSVAATERRSFGCLDSLPPLPVLPASITSPRAPQPNASTSAYTVSSEATTHATRAHDDEDDSNDRAADCSGSIVTALDASNNGPANPSTSPPARRYTIPMAISPPPLAGLGPRLPTSPSSPDPSVAPTSERRQQHVHSVPLPPAFTVVPDAERVRTAGTTVQHADPAAGLHDSTRSPPRAGVGSDSHESSTRPHTPSLSQPLSVTSEDALARPPEGHSDASALPPPLQQQQLQQQRVDPVPSNAGSVMEPRAESFVSAGPSEADANVNSIIQSMGVSFAEADGNQFLSMSFVQPAELPTQIIGKNGTMYMRSNRVLGRGSFGSVYLGMDVHSGKLVAIKFLPMPSDESELSAVEAEVVIMQRVKDSHVVEFITYAFETSNIILVMECMMAGSLQNMITAFKIIPSATAHVFMRDVLRGLNKLHTMGVIHRDVKPQNVLLTLAGNCKISDFGASAWLHELARKESEGLVLGTPVYLAPEAARGMPVVASDIWSCGIMFLQLITGNLPYPKECLSMPAPILVYQIGIGSAVPVIPETLDELDAVFVKSCLQSNPQDRKTARDLLQLPLFSL